MEDFQSSSSFRILKQTVPDGYILGCGITGLNWPIFYYKKKLLICLLMKIVHERDLFIYYKKIYLFCIFVKIVSPRA